MVCFVWPTYVLPVGVQVTCQTWYLQVRCGPDPSSVADSNTGADQQLHTFCKQKDQLRSGLEANKDPVRQARPKASRLGQHQTQRRFCRDRKVPWLDAKGGLAGSSHKLIRGACTDRGPK